MKFGFPWSVKDIRPDARDTAREAARRAGLPVNEWLNAVILQHAAGQNANAFARGNDGVPADHNSQNNSQVHLRLDNLARRIDQVTRRGPAAYAPKRNRDDADQVAELISRLEQRFDQFAATSPAVMPAAPNTPVPPGLDRAVAEISARRRALNGEAAPAAAPAPVPMPTQDLSGLENELRRITNQIETLRRPGVEEAINALRAELGAIGRTLNEAMPRRALEAIERQIQDLNQRIAEGRQAGINSGALEGIERGLADVRDALRDLTPAENLVGYTDAINALAHKIDLIVAQQDPATMMQLERSITTLRELAAHVASNETVNSLAAHVQSLGAKVDQLAASGTGAAINNLEQRIDEISRALAQRTQTDDGVPGRLEALIRSMSDKIEQMQRAHSEPVAFGHLEDRIVKLVQRLDASDARLGHLEAVERGLTDLLVHIEELRANKQSSALRVEDTSGIDMLKQDVARTQSTVEAVHGTLGHVVERLTEIEKDIRSDRRASAVPENNILELTQPAANLGIAMFAAEPEIVPQPVSDVPEEAAAMSVAEPAPVAAEAPPAPAPVINRQPAANVAPIITDTLPDQPLEPGSGPPRATMNPGARIVASEAGFGSVRPAAATTGGKSSYIAAARRAAQAAGQDPKTRSPRADASKDNGKSVRSKMMRRVKSLFLAASIVAIVIGSNSVRRKHFQLRIFRFGQRQAHPGFRRQYADRRRAGNHRRRRHRTSPALADSQPASDQDRATAPATSSADITASLLAPPTLPGLSPAKPAAAPAMTTIQPGLNINQPARNAPPVNAMPALSAPLPNAPPEPKADVTGSIARAPAGNRPPQPATQPTTDRLPAAIGGPRLRTAALNGDAAAAYEIAHALRRRPRRARQSRGSGALVRARREQGSRARRSSATPACSKRARA